MHIPAVFAVLASRRRIPRLTLGLITGFLSRIAALGIAVNMLVAVKMVHAANGFFMNWMGDQKGEGFEYHLLALGLALIVLIYGAGKLSVDSALVGRAPKKV